MARELHALGDARTATGAPTITWLSPLYRDETYWQLPQNPAGPGSQGLVPAELSWGARIQVIFERDIGYAAARHEFRYLELRQYLSAT
jgi:hypothetical protein